MGSLKIAIISFAQDLMFSKYNQKDFKITIELPSNAYHRLKNEFESDENLKHLTFGDEFTCNGVYFKLIKVD